MYRWKIRMKGCLRPMIPVHFLTGIKGAVIDEAQRAPELFSYMQGILDTVKTDGFSILTGSNNFLLQQSISQSLAGRIGYIDLLPLCYREILLHSPG